MLLYNKKMRYKKRPIRSLDRNDTECEKYSLQSLVLLADQNNQISVRDCVLRQKGTDLKEI